MPLFKLFKSYWRQILVVAVFFLINQPVLVGTTAAAEGGNAYYVATTGSDSNAGTISAPFRTIQKGVDTAQAGDAIIVKNGTYTATCTDAEGGFQVSINKAGTASAPIILKAENKRGAILDVASKCHSSIVFWGGAAYWAIQDFEIKNGYHGGIWSNSGADNIIIKGNLIHDIGRHYYDSSLGQPGVYVDAGGVNWTFDGNEFYNIGRTGGSQLFHDHALYLHSQNTLVTNNVFHIQGPGTGDFIDGWGVHTADLFAGNIVNNTFYGPQKNGKEGQIMLWDRVGPLIIRNNIFYNPNSQAIVTYTPNFTSTCLVDYNIVYGATIGGHASCTASNNTTTDPKFISVPNDLHLQSGSPAIDAGSSASAPATDMDGDARPQGGAYDKGADEYTGQSGDTTTPSTPTNLSASTVSSSQINLSWFASTDNVGVTGYKIYRGGTQIATVTSGTSYQNTGLSASTNYSYTVSAYDAAGNNSASSNAVNGTTQSNATPTVSVIGINTSGAEYSWETYPTMSDLDYLKGKGITLLRVPFAWEKIQPILNGPLNQTELGKMQALLSALAARGMSAIIDMHNYARYNSAWATSGNVAPGQGSIIGSTAVPYSAFKDVWIKIATALKEQSGLAGYDIMNEPYNMGGTTVWPTAAQNAVDGIRSVDTATTIYVEGTQWASAYWWPGDNGNLHISDPANNLVYEAHLYFDGDGSGTYKTTYDAQGAYDNLGVDKVKPFLNWLKTNNAKGFIGEFGVPQDDPRWLTILNNFMAYILANNVSGTYWEYLYRTPSGASWWPNVGEKMAITPIQNWGVPQMGVITNYTQPGSVTDTTPPTTPQNLSASTISSSAINLSWTASTDNVGVTGYKAYRNGSLLTTTNSQLTTYSDTGLSPLTSYSYTVSAYDAAGNNSVQSSSSSTTTQSPVPKYPRKLQLTSLEGLTSITAYPSLTITVLSTSGSTMETQTLTPNASKQYTVAFLSTDPQLVNIRIKATGYLSQSLTNIDTTVNSASALTVPQLLAGDLNNDNTINALDYSVLNSHWNQNYPTADINQDRLVNSLDFAVLKNNFNKTGQ